MKRPIAPTYPTDMTDNTAVARFLVESDRFLAESSKYQADNLKQASRNVKAAIILQVIAVLIFGIGYWLRHR